MICFFWKLIQRGLGVTFFERSLLGGAWVSHKTCQDLRVFCAVVMAVVNLAKALFAAQFLDNFLGPFLRREIREGAMELKKKKKTFAEASVEMSKSMETLKIPLRC